MRIYGNEIENVEKYKKCTREKKKEKERNTKGLNNEELCHRA